MATQFAVDLVFKSQGLNNIQAFERELGKVNGQAQKVGDELEDATKRGTAGFGALKAAIAGLGLGALATGIIKTTSSFEQLELSLTAFTGSTEQAQAAFEAFKYIAVESPFDTMQVAGAGKTLLSFGASANEAADMTRRLSMVAGATGADLGLMALNLGQIRTAGKATTVDLKQMATQGIPIYQELAKVMYGTADAAAQVQQDVSEGKVSYQEVQKAITSLTAAGSAYEKQAKSQLNSLQGLWATLQSAVQEAGNAIGEAFGDQIRAGLGKAIGYVEAMAKWLQENSKQIEAFARGAVGLLRALLPIGAAILVVVKAYQAWQMISKAVAATQAFLLGLTGAGLIKVGLAAGAAVAAYAAINKVTGDAEAGVSKLNAQAQQSGDRWADLLGKLNGGKQPVKEMTDQQELFKAEVEKSKTAYSLMADEIDRAAQRQDMLASKEAAIVSFKQALLSLEQQQLDIAYKNATTADERFGIAVRQFNVAAGMAALEFEAQKATNAEAVRAVELQIKKNELKYKEIAAEKALAEARGQSTDKYDEALSAQDQVVSFGREQLAAAKEIEAVSNGVAAVQYQQKVLAAEIALSTKLQSDEIGIAKQRADEMAASYGRAAVAASDAARAIGAANAAMAAGRQQGGGGPAGSMYIQGGGQVVDKKYYASGGYVTGPTNAVVGEAGAEYVIPADKMDQAMMRYASGQRGPSVIPSSASVNVTYSGSVVNMGGTDFISKKDVPGLLSSAVNQTLTTLQRSPNSRRFAGIR